MSITPLETARAMFMARCLIEGMSNEEIEGRILDNEHTENEFADYLFDARLMLEWYSANEPEARALAEIILAQPPGPIEFDDELIVDELEKATT